MYTIEQVRRCLRSWSYASPPDEHGATSETARSTLSRNYWQAWPRGIIERACKYIGERFPDQARRPCIGFIFLFSCITKHGIEQARQDWASLT